VYCSLTEKRFSQYHKNAFNGRVFIENFCALFPWPGAGNRPGLHSQIPDIPSAKSSLFAL